MPKEILKNENKTEDKKDDKLMPSSSINKQGKYLMRICLYNL